MTSLRKVIDRLLGSQDARPDLPDPDFDYRVFWTKEAMAWNTERQKEVLAAIQTLKEETEHADLQVERRYHLQGLEDEDYTGASLIALETVLRAILEK